MTRSKQALYVLTTKLKEDTSAKNFARLMMLTIHSASDVVEIGDENWFDGHQIGNVEKGVSRSGEESILPCTAGTPHSQSPSSLAVKLHSAEQSGARATFSSDAADLGTEIHEVFSRIAWDRNGVDLSGCSVQARNLLAPFLQSKVAGEIFTKPGEDWDLWNERAFDLMIDNVWISGIFDRVHICRKDGRAVEARIYDYKTNRSTPEEIAKEYEGQMEQYRKAIAALLGIGVDQVSAQTVPIRLS